MGLFYLSLTYLSDNNSLNAVGFDSVSPPFAYHQPPQIGLFVAVRRPPANPRLALAGMALRLVTVRFRHSLSQGPKGPISPAWTLFFIL